MPLPISPPSPQQARTATSGLLCISTTLLLAGSAALAAPSTPTVYVAYPPAEYRVAADHVILEGSVTPGASLKISGVSAQVAPDGLFMLWWPLKAGANALKLVATRGGQSGSATIRVTRTLPPSVATRPTMIARTTVTPRENIEFWDTAHDTPAERTITVSFVGSAGGRASLRVTGSAALPMREGPAGTYTGQYVVPAQASLNNAALSVTLVGKDGKTATATAPGRLKTTGALHTGTQKAGTVQGLGLNDAQNYATTLDGQPALFVRNGMTFTLVGRQGNDVRARLAPGQSVLISASQLDLTPGAPALARSGEITVDGATVDGAPGGDNRAAPQPARLPASPLPTSPLPTSPVPVSPIPDPPPADRIPSTPPETQAAPAPDSGFQATPQPVQNQPVQNQPVQNQPVQTFPDVLPPIFTMNIPLGGVKVPFTITQTGPRQLVLKLYGLLTAPSLPHFPDPLLSEMHLDTQPGVTTITIDLAYMQLWGFTANYAGSGLVLTIKRPPVLDAARPLAGRTITIDPGHGGSQAGGAGSFRVPEKELVLPIARRVAELLRAQGANIVMTRDSDVTLGLYERDLIAEQAQADLLVSIHANALPDGRDPRGIRGPEILYTHPQAQAVSDSILKQIRARLPELGTGAGLLGNQNLALTRPTTQISLLVETAYLTDPGNLRVLMSADGKERFAQAIAGGITDFYAAQPR